MREGRIRHFIFLGVLLLALAGTATAQLQTGDLYGTVTDDQGEPLPGVTVTLTGVGAPRIQITNAEGQFRFLGLPPGRYQLAATLEGFSTVEYPNIVIQVGRSTEISVTLSPAVEETITVTAESPLLDERRLNRGANVSVEELDKIPTARDPWSLLSQAPGVLVDRINVGGNESGQQSNFLGTGSSAGDNEFSVDGVILTDMAAVGASLTYFDFGAFEEVQFTVSSADVTKATAGVTVNQVTKRGTNEWRGAARYLRTDGELQSSPANIGGQEGNQIESVEEYGADIGGPLWKDRMWVWASYGESDIQNIVIGGQLDRTQLEDFNSKLNFQPTPSNSGVLHYWTNDKIKNGRGAGPNRSPETTWNQTTPADIWKVEDSHVFSSDFFATGLWSTNDGIFTLETPAGPDNDAYWDADGVLRGSYLDFAQKGYIEQARLDASYFFNTGDVSHELKFGGSFREQENSSGTIWPRGRLVYSCEFFGCDPSNNQALVQAWRDKSLAISSTYDSFWAQDTITTDRWTINVGVRYDEQQAENLASTSPANPVAPDLVPELVFPGNDAGGFTWETLVPRVGVTYALGEERKTLLRGSFSRYAEQLGQNLAQRVNPLGYSYAAFYFTDADGDLALDDNELGSLYFYGTYNLDASSPLAVSTPNVNDPDLDPTITDELTLGVDHALRPELAVGATLTYRNISDLPETRTLVTDASGNVRVATRNDYVFGGTVSGVLPNGQVSERPYFVLSDDLTPTGGRLYTNGSREQDYLGVSLNATKRLSNRWTLRGHLTWNDWDWSLGDEFVRFDDPTDTTNDSNQDELDYSDNDGDPVAEVSSGSGDKKDVWTGGKWSFNINGLYQVAPDKPWGFNVGASVTGREGFPSPPYVPVGSRRVQLADFDQFHNDDILIFDARVDKDFEFNDFKVTLSIDGFNLLNENYVLQRERNLASGTANQVREVLSPRVFRVGLKLTFR